MDRRLLFNDLCKALAARSPGPRFLTEYRKACRAFLKSRRTFIPALASGGLFKLVSDKLDAGFSTAEVLEFMKEVANARGVKVKTSCGSLLCFVRDIKPYFCPAHEYATRTVQRKRKNPRLGYILEQSIDVNLLYQCKRCGHIANRKRLTIKLKDVLREIEAALHRDGTVPMKELITHLQEGKYLMVKHNPDPRKMRSSLYSAFHGLVSPLEQHGFITISPRKRGKVVSVTR